METFFDADFEKIKELWKLNDEVYKILMDKAESDPKLKCEMFNTDSNYFIEIITEVMKEVINE